MQTRDVFRTLSKNIQNGAFLQKNKKKTKTKTKKLAAKTC